MPMRHALASGPVAVAVVLWAVSGADTPAGNRPATPQVIVLAPGTIAYRPPGEFSRAGQPADAPPRTTRIERDLAIMRRQVTAAEYQACTDAGACPRIPGLSPQPDRPAVFVSWHDATAYAAWLSRETGARFRLPTDEEWTYAAGSRFKDEGLGIEGSDPGQRALALYDVAARSGSEAIAEPQPIGTFGTNEHGLVDLAGNVWEWTDSCFVRG